MRTDYLMTQGRGPDYYSWLFFWPQDVREMTVLTVLTVLLVLLVLLVFPAGI
jgi:hypothetical protein